VTSAWAARLAAVLGWDAAMTARMLDEYRAEVRDEPGLAHGNDRSRSSSSSALYGATLVIAFVAGMFPLISIEGVSSSATARCGR